MLMVLYPSAYDRPVIDEGPCGWMVRVFRCERLGWRIVWEDLLRIDLRIVVVNTGHDVVGRLEVTYEGLVFVSSGTSHVWYEKYGRLPLSTPR